MNYDHINQIHDYLTKEIRPHVKNNFQVASFDEYLKKFSFLKSGKWLKDMESVRLSRSSVAYDPVEFLKRYGKQSVAVNVTTNPEHGQIRIILQLSPTLHLDCVLWAWIEHNKLQSYLGFLACHNTDKEFDAFIAECHDLRRTGNTEERNTGFHPMSPLTLPSQS